MQLGMESGEVVEIGGDCFGDAVNTAARLADLAGGGQILTTAQVRGALPGALRSLLHSMGPLFLRGKADATEVFRVQWRDESEGEVTVMGVALRRSECPLVGSGYISLGCERSAHGRLPITINLIAAPAIFYWARGLNR
jgi:hypothetical protein